MGPWDEAIECGARGQYARARRFLDLIGENDRHYSLALSTRGSHARQVGASGTAWDSRALEVATDTESIVDAVVGLAADEVVNGDVSSARRHLAQACAALGREGAVSDLWRSLTRLHWVSAEAALLAGERETALEEARAARRSCAGRSTRHETKSLIISMAAGDEFARSQADAVFDVLVGQGWTSLQWPFALVLDDARIEREADDPFTRDLRARTWRAAQRAIDAIAADLPPDLADSWRDHPGVRRIRGGPVA
ncbi:MAG: hypothetical protein VW362_00580 [Candidatus Nanopelagicales bacterium]